MVAVISSQGSLRQIRQCKRSTALLPRAVFDAAAYLGLGGTISRDAYDDVDDSPREVVPDECEPALVATKIARFSRMKSGIPSAETNTIEWLESDVGE